MTVNMYCIMRKKDFIIYFGFFVLLCVVTCFLQPHDDDWQYLYYFENPQLWGLSKESFVGDCILLPGTYWRPLWSMFNWVEAHLFPMSMPYANHVFIVFGMVGIAYMTKRLLVLLNCKNNIATIVSLMLVFATTSMGALLSVDSFQNVYATFFGLMSVMAYQSTKKTKWLFWFLAGWLAAWSKETGFVWFVAGPIFEELIRQKHLNGHFSFSNVKYKSLIIKLVICILPIVMYLGLYVMLKPSVLDSVGVANDTEVTIASNVTSQTKESEMLSDMTDMKKNNSYKLTPATFLKNIAILYVLGIIPIDTSAIYFKTYSLLVITTILSILWLVIFGCRIKNHVKELCQELCLLLLLMIWISGPSLITRAGEISSIIHMTIVAIMSGLLFNRLKMSKALIIAVICFSFSTIITDCHKYYIAYKAGDITREMAKKVVSETMGNPTKVLMVQVDDFSKKKSGAFMINPADGIRKGSAMIREYQYKYPKELVYEKIPEEDDVKLQAMLDSIVIDAQGKFDCVWYCHDTQTKVFNLK